MRRMTTERERLLNELDQFQAVSGLSDTAIGTDALRDPNWVHRLRLGSDPKLGTVDKIRKFMREWRPNRTHPKQRDHSRAVA